MQINIGDIYSDPEIFIVIGKNQEYSIFDDKMYKIVNTKCADVEYASRHYIYKSYKVMKGYQLVQSLYRELE